MTGYVTYIEKLKLKFYNLLITNLKLI